MLYDVTVVFNSDILDIKENSIKIGIKTKPIRGKANTEIIKKLAKYFEVDVEKVIIRSGQKQKRKQVEILDR